MRSIGLSLTLSTVLAAVSSVAGAPRTVAQPPASSAGAPAFRDIARRENPVVVSIETRWRVREKAEGDNDIARLFDPPPPDLDQRVHVSTGSGFVIGNSGDILTSSHLVDGAERIDVRLFGNERKRYRAIRVGSDPMTDVALIRLENPPPDLQAARLGDSSTIEPGDWVLAIGHPFQLLHSVTVGIVSFARRVVQVDDRRWQDMIQTDAAVNSGSSGGPLFNARGEVVGMSVATRDGDSWGGVGFALPINAVKALLPQLRTGKVARGQLGVQLHGGPILEDEAAGLRLPRAAGSIVMSVDDGSAAECAGLRAGDVIVEIDGKPVADTRDLIARTAAIAPGTRVTMKIFRKGQGQTLATTIEAQPVGTIEEAPPGDFDSDDGLTLGEVAPPAPGRPPRAFPTGGALVVNVAPHSPADDAALLVGDIVRAINGRPVHTAGEATHQLHAIEPGRPIFLLVSRRGRELFLEMRKN